MKYIIFGLLLWNLNLNAQMQFYFFPSTFSVSNQTWQKGKQAERKIRHDMKIKFDFSKNFIEVTDSFLIPDKMQGFSFYLHKGLEPVSLTKEIFIEPISNTDILPMESLNKGQVDSSIFEYYYLETKPGIKTAKIKYTGVFSDTTSIISEQGCYLSGSSGFYPRIAEELVTFRIETELPKDYVIVTQGERLSDVVHGNLRKTVWSEKNPQEDITIACGKFKEYSAKQKDKTFYVFLRNSDEKLAKKYLETTKQYIEMYSKLIGEYPYKKFALVENLQETNYSVPSFVLLEPKVLHLPFIQEVYLRNILYNWWGNGVFVDYEKGNWAKGLTEYLADYLMAEQHRKDKEYRMTVLQKYSDYVSKSQDFPIIEFISGHSEVENIFHGKTMMFYHMLRQKAGDKNFTDALKHFYTKNKFRRASFEDIKSSFEQVLDDNLDYFFDQWLTKPGMTELELKNAFIEKLTPPLLNSLPQEEKSLPPHPYVLKFEILQKQDDPYDLDIPVVVHLENETHAFRTFVNTNQKSETFEIKFSSKPLILEIDPEFDLFRKLTPDSLSVIFQEDAKKLSYPEREPLVYLQ